MASNTNIYTTGYNVQVVDSYPPLLNCGVCTLILRDAMHGCINHVFCKACITKHIECGIKINGNVMCPGGCNIVINPGKLEPSKVVDRMVNTLTTRCSNDGCTWQGDLLDLVQVHQINCDFILQTCVNNGCNQNYLKKDILQHNEECLFKIIQCNYCQTEVLRMNKEAHAVECLNEHVKCIYYDIGCKKELCRKDIHSHEQTNHAEHTRFIYQKLTDSNNEIKDLNQANVTMKQQHDTMKQEIIVLKQEIISLEQKNATLKQETVEQKQEIAVMKEEFVSSMKNYEAEVDNRDSKATDKLDAASNEAVLMKSREKLKNMDSLKEKLNMNGSLNGYVSLEDDDKVLVIKFNKNDCISLFNEDFCKCYETNDFDWLCYQFRLMDNKSIIMELINNTKYHFYDYKRNNRHYMFVFPLDMHHIKDIEVIIPDIFKMTIVDNEIMVERLSRKIFIIQLYIEMYEIQLKHKQKLNLQQLECFKQVDRKSAKGYAFLLLTRFI